MASDYSYISPENITVETKSSGKIEKGLKRILLIAGIIILAELIWLFGISPFIPFTVIEVHGFEGFERQEILFTAGIDDSSSFISTNISKVKESLLSHLLVESAAVIKRFPDKLSVFLHPREAVAVSLAGNDSKQALLYIDRHGVFYGYASSGLRDLKLPVISGFENPQPGMRLPTALIPMTESLFSIADSSPELLATISEIRVERKPWEGFDLVIFTVHSPIKVRIENNLTEDTLRYILLMLSVFESSPSKPDEIDFRSGMGSYITAEQSL